ncbi:hypothetical protein DFJ74DRAFT_672569 [Hyaloraphidium curvatum]|nr:hypothetical protein DFJ74DRAFT_672569 [Hyaloraphidium curvatum]
MGPLLAVLLAFASVSVVAASPTRVPHIFARSCADCDPLDFCEFGFPNNARGHVACVSIAPDDHRLIYRSYDVCTGPGMEVCSGNCVNKTTDGNNCGTCSTTCGGTTPECCSGSCFDLDSNNEHCGSCANSCTAQDADAYCQSGYCYCPIEKPALCATGCSNPNTDYRNCGNCCDSAIVEAMAC